MCVYVYSRRGRAIPRRTERQWKLLKKEKSGIVAVLLVQGGSGGGGPTETVSFIDQKLSFIRVDDETRLPRDRECRDRGGPFWGFCPRYYPGELREFQALTGSKRPEWPQVELSFGLEIIWLIAPG